MAASVAENLQQLWDVLGIMLAVAIHANDIIVTKLVSEFVSCLHAAAETQMIRQAQDVGAGRPCAFVCAIAGGVIDNQNRYARHHAPYLVDHARDGAHLIEGGNQN